MKKFVNSALGISLICTAFGVSLAFLLDYFFGRSEGN